MIRDRDGVIVGFNAMFDPAAADRVLLRAGPITRRWSERVRDHPVPKGESVFFLRRWPGVEGREEPSPIQAAGWLDA